MKKIVALFILICFTVLISNCGRKTPVKLPAADSSKDSSSQSINKNSKEQEK